MVTAVKNQRGSTTLDFLFAGALIAQSFGVFTQLSYANSADLQTLAASQYMSQFSGAVQQYVADNASTILSGSLPKQIPASALTPAYLPAGTSSTNPLGQTVCAKVVSPAANQLSALVMTDGPALQGNQQQKLALNLGAKAGIVATTGGPLAGVGGSWSMSNATLQSYGTCSAGAGTAMGTGQVAVNLFFSSLSLTSDYLHRTAIPGNGSATTMNSPLGLATVTDGATCTQTGQIAATSMGVIEACQGSVWTAAGGGTWKAPTASYATLPASGNTSGDARVTTDTQRMYVWNGAVWAATGVDQNGNLTVPGDVTAKTLTLTGTATEGSSCPKNGQVTQDSAGLLLSCQSGSWSAQHGVKAWVNFDGTNCPSGWCSIRAQYNVSGVYKNSTGRYLAYFSKPLPDIYYALTGMATDDLIGATMTYETGTFGANRSTSYAGVVVVRVLGGGATGVQDATSVNVTVTR